MIVEVPRRKFNFDIDGKIFEAKELSIQYLQNAQMNPHEDTAENAIKDSMGEIPKEDLQLFGMDTQNILYSEILKFTFEQVLTEEDIEDLISEFGMTEVEINALDRNAKAQLKSILLARKPQEEEPEKKKPLIDQ